MHQLNKASPELDLQNATLVPLDAASNLNPIQGESRHTREIQAVEGRPIVVGLYITGDGSPERPLNINVPALASALINAMTCANFTALKNGIAMCEGAGATGGIGAGGAP